MPIVNISLTSGRSESDLHDVMVAVSNAIIDTLKIPAESVRVLLHEISEEHWSVGNETLAERRQGRIEKHP